MKKILRLLCVVATEAFAPAVAVNQALIQSAAEQGNPDAVATLMAEDNRYDAMTLDDKFLFLAQKHLLNSVTGIRELEDCLASCSTIDDIIFTARFYASQSTKDNVVVPKLLALAQTPGLTIEQQRYIQDSASIFQTT